MYQQTRSEARAAYESARKQARTQFFSAITQGRSGHLPTLDSILRNAEIASEIDLGLVDIPIRKIIGTITHSRSLSFSENFRPLSKEGSEFYFKWCSLYESHLKQGIRDPIKIYEYMNWFYVEEGNKRVSVLKYLDAISMHSKVIRLVPKRDEENPSIKRYYDFMEFNNLTGIFSIWIKKEDGFKELTRKLEKYTPELTTYTDKYSHFFYKVYLPFRKVLKSTGGDKFTQTTGDAFLEFTRLYGIPNEIDETDDKDLIKTFTKELQSFSKDNTVEVETKPLKKPKKNVISSISNLMVPQKVYQVAFAYAKTVATSGWTNAHEKGRLHASEVLQEKLSTSYIENVPENMKAYEVFKQLAESGNDIIITTSPSYLKPSLKVALEYPDVRFLNCSGSHSYKHVITYFGRTHEVRFLLGLIAGTMTKTDIIGYIATYHTPEIIAGVNAFALGVKSVNPWARIKVRWTEKWDHVVRSKMLARELSREGADIINQNDLPPPEDVTAEYGLYAMECNKEDGICLPIEHYASLKWNWGAFYERILRTLISGTYKSLNLMVDPGAKRVNFWWGVDSGVIDLVYNKETVPIQVQKLVGTFRKMIQQNEYDPFHGPIVDQHGTVRVEAHRGANFNEILSMDWLVDNIDGKVPT